jgi:hypothetical protein
MNSSGDYKLGNDLSISGRSACISMSSLSDGSTLDCDHYTISGPATNGIGVLLKGTQYATVKNCNIESASYGIMPMSCLISPIISVKSCS